MLQPIKPNQWLSYMWNILYEDLLPILEDNDKQVYGSLSHIQHWHHMDYKHCKGLSIGCSCKLCYLDSLCHIDTLLFELQIKKY